MPGFKATQMCIFIFYAHGAALCSISFALCTLNCFWWNRSPYCLYFPLPPLRGQPTTKCHPIWQPISGQQSIVGWGDCWIRTQDCSFTIWCRYQWATTAPKWATTAPTALCAFKMFHEQRPVTFLSSSLLSKGELDSYWLIPSLMRISCEQLHGHSLYSGTGCDLSWKTSCTA